MSFARVNIASRHRSFDETKTHRAALLEVHEPLLALEKLHASSSHTAVRSSVCARDGRLAFYVVHARISRRRPRSNPPRLDARDRSNPKLARAPIARTLARASSRALALARSLSRAIDNVDVSFAPFAPRRSCRSWSTIDRSNNDDAGEETSLTVSRLGTKS